MRRLVILVNCISTSVSFLSIDINNVQQNFRRTIYSGDYMNKLEMKSADSTDKVLLKSFHEQNRYGLQSTLQYDDNSNTFKTILKSKMSSSRSLLSSIQHVLYSCFLPSGKLTTDYYSYTMWRLVQRFISATNSVFGTQALLLALGFKKNQIGIS